MAVVAKSSRPFARFNGWILPLMLYLSTSKSNRCRKPCKQPALGRWVHQIAANRYLADSSASRGLASVVTVAGYQMQNVSYLATLCSRQMMNTPLAMITAAPTKVSASGISFQNSQPSAVAQMMAV